MKASTATPTFQKTDLQRNQERTERKQAWVENGSDDLREAWVSVCATATTHEVQDFRLCDVLTAIRQGRITIWDAQKGPVDFDLGDQQERVRQLFAEGVAEAKTLNLHTKRKIVDALGLDVPPEAA